MFNKGIALEVCKGYESTKLGRTVSLTVLHFPPPLPIAKKIAIHDLVPLDLSLDPCGTLFTYTPVMLKLHSRNRVKTVLISNEIRAREDNASSTQIFKKERKKERKKKHEKTSDKKEF